MCIRGSRSHLVQGQVAQERLSGSIDNNIVTSESRCNHEKYKEWKLLLLKLPCVMLIAAIVEFL